MAQNSPIRQAFSSVWRDPAIVLAEIAWRWTFGAAAIALSAASLMVYLNSLTVSRAELWALRSQTPFLVVDAVVHILRGSGPRFVLGALLVTFALSVAWIFVASLGRAATLARLCSATHSEFGARRRELRGLVVLHFIRAVFFYLTVIAYIGAAILADRAAKAGAEPSPTVYLAIFFLLALVISFAHSRVVWLASVATIFIVGRSQSVLGAVQRAAGLYARHPGQIARINTIFGVVHFVVFVVASFMSFSAFALFGQVPAGVAIAVIATITIVYFGFADFLYIGRLAAYVSLIEGDDSAVAPQPGVPDPALPAGPTAPALESPAW